MTNIQSQISNIQSQLEPAYPHDEALALAWWIAEELSGLTRTQLQIGCKGTTNFPKLQDFYDKNDLCLHKNLFIAQKDCSSQDNANVASGEDCRQLSCEAKNACKKAESEDTKIVQTIIDRLLHFEPIQYIFGHTLWNGLDLKLTPATLIPRPETAELVERINQMANGKWSNGKCLDVGTGSGCIAIALKKAHPEWHVTGIDISPEAIGIARENARRNNVEVDFQVADIFSDQMVNGKWLNGKWFDIIVSNPPYIRESEKVSMKSNVLDYEPHSALFVPDNDPLKFYRRIAELKGKYLFFEINEAFAAEMEALLREYGYTDIQLTRDIYGKPRIIEARMMPVS